MFSAPATGRPWLDELNPEQRRAATHVDGPLLVLAGAGTGKTTTLTARVAWLIAEGVPAERILLLTFTRRAARDMLARTRALLRRSDAARAGPLGGTFHSVAHRLVRMHAAALGLPAGFGVIDASDAADVLDLVREELGLAGGQKRFPRKETLLAVYSRSVNGQRPLSEVLGESFPWCAEYLDELAVLFRAYTERKRSACVLDLDDLLVFWRAAAREPTIGRRLEDSFDHVLVDEYQDTNGLQVDVVRALRQRCRGLTVVGDDAQAVYGFRAASAEHILWFPEHFPDKAILGLKNYLSRSTPELFDEGP